MTVVEDAIALGLPVFPCREDKKPACYHGFKDAQTEPDKIRALWRNHYGSLIGVPTGAASGFVAIDIDPQGLPWLRAKLHMRRFPATRVHQTPRGGYHFLYRPPPGEIRNSSSKLSWGIDIRGEGGYVIHPPSPGYSVVDESEYARFPVWIIKALERIAAKEFEREQRGFDLADANALERFVISSKLGERNSRTFWAACRAGEAGTSAAEARLIAAAISIGLDEQEASATVRSGLNRGMRDGRRQA